MTDDILLESRDGAVATLTMNRPKARNSLSLQMLERLTQAFQNLGADENIHVIVLRGNGVAFCAGHDLKEMTAARANEDGGRGFYEETMQACATMMQTIVNCPKPVIAQVHGIATAAGSQLVASCDLALAANDARFATPGVNIGLFCSTPMVALSRNVGRKAAMEMLLTGELFSAEQVRQWGLVSRVVAPEILGTEVADLAARIASKAPRTLAIGKEAFYRQAEMKLSDAYDFAADVMVQNMMAEDAREGIDAFLGKRSAHWQPLGAAKTAAPVEAAE